MQSVGVCWQGAARTPELLLPCPLQPPNCQCLTVCCDPLRLCSPRPLASSTTLSSSSPTSPESSSTGEPSRAWVVPRWAGLACLPACLVKPPTSRASRSAGGPRRSAPSCFTKSAGRQQQPAIHLRPPCTLPAPPRAPPNLPALQFGLPHRRERRRHQQEAHQGDSAGAAEEGLEIGRVLSTAACFCAEGRRFAAGPLSCLPACLLALCRSAGLL